MIAEINSPHPNTLIYDIEYFITEYELDIIQKGIEETLKKYDSVNLMLYLHVEGENLSALVKEFKLGLTYWNKINKIAYICDTGYLKPLIAIDNLFTKFKEKCFTLEEVDKAWDWINDKNIKNE